MALNAYMFLQLNGTDIEGSSSVATVAGVDVSRAIELVECRFRVARAETAESRRGSVRFAHAPFWALKRIDRATPLLLQGFVQNQQVDATIRFFKSSAETGEMSNYFNIELRQGRINLVEGHLPNQLEPASAGQLSMEAFEIVYQTMTVRHNFPSVEFELPAIDIR